MRDCIHHLNTKIFSILSYFMSFIPPWEEIIETKKCRISGKDFFVTDKDLEFYEKISPIFAGQKYLIPSPTLCPDERQRRRLTFRNERKLYHRKCDKTGNQIISIYSPDKPYTVYDQKVWWWDDWSPMDYGMKFDFNIWFFEQFRKLQLKVPRVNLFTKNCENADFTNHTDHIKNCYLCIDTAGSENIYYSKWVINCKNCIDSHQIEDCELSYECQYCVNLHSCNYCFLCYDSSNCLFSYRLQNCRDCMFCTHLRWKQYCIFNEQLSKEEYEKKRKTLETQNQTQLKQIKDIFQKFKQKWIVENLIMDKSENTFGDFIYHSKNAFSCFEALESENVRYCYEDMGIKDSYDVYESWFECEQQYECHASNRVKFSSFCSLGYDNSFMWYTELCNNSHHCFGCIGLKKKGHCILNTSYSTHEYDENCWKIISHMQSTGEWGEFFPHTLSPFGYDETLAQEYFPLLENEAKKQGWKWKWIEETSSYHGPYYEPKNINEYDEKRVDFETAQKNIDKLLAGIIRCEISWKPFKVIKQELIFYIENHIPIPTKHPDQRHVDRLGQRNPRTLYERNCWECGEKIITTYPPETLEKIVCEKCYKKIIY